VERRTARKGCTLLKEGHRECGKKQALAPAHSVTTCSHCCSSSRGAHSSLPARALFGHGRCNRYQHCGLWLALPFGGQILTMRPDNPNRHRVRRNSRRSLSRTHAVRSDSSDAALAPTSLPIPLKWTGNTLSIGEAPSRPNWLELAEGRHQDPSVLLRSRSTACLDRVKQIHRFRDKRVQACNLPGAHGLHVPFDHQSL